MGELGRFTTWLSAAERKALAAAARRENRPVAALVRTAIRQYIGNDALMDAAKELAGEVTVVTGNTDE